MMYESAVPDPWLVLLISALFGGLMGAVINIIYQRRSEQRLANIRERSAIRELKSEMRCCIAFCDYNAGIKDDPTGPFTQFPTTAALTVTFKESYQYPQLALLHNKLVHYVMGLMKVNQLMELHQVLWMANERPTGSYSGASGRRDDLRLKIAAICAGKNKLLGVGPEGFLDLPQYIRHLITEMDKVK